MKRPLVVVFLIALFSFVLAQQTEYIRDPPKVSDFPPVPRTCKNKQKLYVSTVAGVPAGSERGSALVSCQFHTVDCRGAIKRYNSFPRPGSQHVCDGWQAARDAMATAALETCCDPEAANETRPAEDEKPKCQPPTSWFDPTGTCKDKRSPWAQVRGREVILTVCGVEVFRRLADSSDRLFVEAYRRGVIEEFTQQVGSKVCCDQFRDAVRNGVPCDPSKDLDCDGVPNESDTFTSSGLTFPDIDAFNRPAGARIDPFPVGLNPDDEDFLPNRTARNSKDVGDCPCKWDLVKGELKCGGGPDGRHVYLATWRCPTTKAEVITTKYASAQTSCP